MTNQSRVQEPTHLSSLPLPVTFILSTHVSRLCNYAYMKKWFEFWKLRCDCIPTITIATSLGKSRQAVSKALLAINGRR